MRTTANNNREDTTLESLHNLYVVANQEWPKEILHGPGMSQVPHDLGLNDGFGCAHPADEGRIWWSELDQKHGGLHGLAGWEGMWLPDDLIFALAKTGPSGTQRSSKAESLH